MGAFWALQPKADCTLTPNEFLHSSPEAPRTTQSQETSASEGRNYYQGIYLANPEFTKVLGSFTCRKAGTWDRFFHFPSEGRHAEDYSDTRKIQRLRPGSSPWTRVPEDSMLTTRPPKPLKRAERRDINGRVEEMDMEGKGLTARLNKACGRKGS